MKRVMRGTLLLGLLLAGVAKAGGPARAARTRATEGPGAALFRDRCQGCHVPRPAGTGDVLDAEKAEGPDLSYAGTRLRPEWVESWLQAPTRVRPAGWLPYRYVVPTAEGDRVDVARLPAHLALSAKDAREVAAHLGGLKRELNPYPIAEPHGAIRAQVHFSKLLPCGGCHQSGAGQGGVSGPELSTAGARLEREWMAAYIADPGYWLRSLMPRSDARSDQIAAIVDYLAQPPAAAAQAPVVKAEAWVAVETVPEPKRRAQRLYRLLCTQCHGVRGDGRGINARHLFVAPRNHRSAQEMGMLTRDSIITAIRSGGSAVGKSSLMPAWGAVLDRPDIELLADYVMTLSGGAAPSRGDLQP
ncbi:c-type cytochrome [Corallococcus sp. Z5C101001]|uniref:c-type cytochrome n=1 Tax=Corallococcus sp. Z5C101001 TaxID=2596829 RepID=UPI00117C6544|nr:c-type cytochrome [Corallococcus sp. Z5C101001]TSC33552.1 c-type cytochrome [Corallococcus sp. Z5C101001]